MGLWLYLKNKFGKEAKLSDEEFAEEVRKAYSNMSIKEMAFWSAVNLIANCVSKCEFKTFLNGAEVKGDEYYLWNYSPNKNQTSSVFLQKLISKLYVQNECLVIEHGEQLVIADSFCKSAEGLEEAVFNNVVINGRNIAGEFVQSEVLFFDLNSLNMNKLINLLYSDYQKLIGCGMRAYQKSKSDKYAFKYDALPAAGQDKENFDKLINEKLITLLDESNTVLTLGRGQNVEKLGKEGKTYSSETTRDIRAMIDDISDFVAKAFGVHPALLRGDVQGTADALDYTLTFCIDPLVDKLQEEINRKRIGKKSVLGGTYVKIDTRAIKHVDLLSVSTAVDKLIGSGVFCINDIREVCGEEIIDEPWANEHFITKNYTRMQEAMKQLEGGEEE